ncbi:hypothetical protein DM01DRAFT_1284673 [Hesseltinella vesiculosa]|uniref:Glycosyltransferase family 32 protein n=1 Tax=Hesseltinella vesiculosa TaxID=101127 RepID=A0A1X2GLX4_9FUNG|nr:hypothetical protein DM01DRAFT_1284673 [Hesseltinella vesiculosa]
MFHYHYLPTGDLFERAKPFLELHQVDLVPTIYDRRLSHFAHQADVIRLDVLRRYGGIYLDLDVISVKPMDDLLNHEFVMGQEGVGGSVGLCNGVILSQPNARFLQRWQQTYHTFNMEQWNYHSVILPGKLAPYFKDEITIQNHTSFFWPLWDSPGLRAIFLEKSYDWADNYATHLWESAANPHLMKDLSEDVIMTIDNSLNCLLRRFLVDDPSTLDAHRCKIIEHSERADGLVGHWSLERRGDAVMNPMPAYDDSGNDMNGLIRNGYYADNDDGVYVNGQDSYVFLPMPSKTILPLPSSWGRPSGVTVQWDMKTASTHTGRAALVIHSNTCKVFIKTQSILGRGLALRVETWLLAENGWSWHRHKDLSVGAGPFVINQDDRYHRYTLILQNDIKEDLLMPNLVLYMDGEVVASISGWSIPAVLPIHREEDLRIRGLWFGSTEPDHYQDPWDTSLSLEAWYKDISMWERAMDIRDVGARAFHNADPL